MSLVALLAGSAARHGARPALVGRDRSLSYAEAWRESGQRAEQLAPGAVVLLSAVNSVDWTLTLLAALRAGALVGVLDPSFGPETRARIERALGAGGEASAVARAIRDAGARLVVFTSGSTGEPKGVLVPEENVVANVAWNRDAFGLDAGAVTCNFMPLSAFLNLSYVVAALAVGATVLIEKNLGDLQGTLGRMDAAGLTHLNTVPLALRTVVERGDLARWPLRALRCVRVGAGLLPFDLAARTLEQFPGARIVATYGMTEIGIVATRTWDADHANPEDVGSYPDVGPDKAITLTDDEGEVVLASPFLHRGYYHPTDDRLELRSGPYATGDLGARSAAGALRIVGRKKRIAKVAGVLVDLDDVSRVGRACPAVTDSVAIGIEHPVLGEEVHLFVAAPHGAGADRETIARALLEGTRTPLRRAPRIHILPVLPRTAMGKIERGALERLARGAE